MCSSRFINFLGPVPSRTQTLATALLVLVGCGDGYDLPSGPNGRPGVEVGNGAEPLVGALIDSVASGVSYETETLRGVTTENGEFQYREGESVRFFIGDTTLGEADGQAEVSMFDLAGTEPLTTGQRGFEEDREKISRAANIATLLQTFDYDGDPANGIEITPEVAALFNGVEVDLDRDIFEFIRERTYRSVLNRANDAQLLDGYRPPKGGVAVMEHVYAELGLEPGFFAPKHESFNKDSDDEIEQTNAYAYRDRYMSMTVRTSTLTHRSSSTTSWTFDDYGNEVTKLVSEEDGAKLWSEPVYDHDRNPLGGTYDLNVDGVVDESRRAFFNEFGDPLGWERDNDGDGVIDMAFRAEYDERGNPVLNEHDRDGDGSPDHVQIWEWNEDRQLIRRLIDADGDGLFELTIGLEYDDAGNKVRELGYPEYENASNWIEEWRYDEQGLEVYNSYDNDADGSPDRVTYSNHDENGHLFDVEYDHDADGVIDRVETYIRDSMGNRLRYEIDEDNDTVVDQIWTYEYDADGNETLKANDVDADGTLDRVTTRTYVTVGWDYFFYYLKDRI